MFILDDNSGIQDVLVDVRETGGEQTHSLRFRSFRVHRTAECVAQRPLRPAGLWHDRLLFCSAATAWNRRCRGC